MIKRQKNAFTLVELLVAMGLFAAIMVIGVLVFRAAIQSQQTAARAADFMRDVGIITQLLDDDFSSLDTDAPFGIWFDKDGNSRIFVFAKGNFQQTGGGNLTTVQVLNNYGGICYQINSDFEFLRYFKAADREQDIIEYSSSANRRNNLFDVLSNPANRLGEPVQLSSRVSSLKVQMLYPTTDGTLRWYPDDNPYPLLSDDSDFNVMGRDSFGVFFNIDAAGSNDFYPPQGLELRLIEPSGNLQPKTNFEAAYKPKALKFIFTLTDAEGNLEDKTFTYVVEIKG